MMSKLAILVSACVVAATAAHASTIVNLSANSVSPNAGTSSGSYTYNPVTVNLAAGTYTVGVVGIAGGGSYDAYSVYAPTASNLAYTDGNWSVLPIGGAVQTELSTNRFNTAAQALSYYSSLAGLTFTLATNESVSFYVDDTVYPYFADDAGGVSLAINQQPVPEPTATAVLGIGLIGLGLVRYGRRPTQASC